MLTKPAFSRKRMDANEDSASATEYQLSYMATLMDIVSAANFISLIHRIVESKTKTAVLVIDG